MSEDGETFTQTAGLFRWITANGASLFFARLVDPVAEEISALALMRRLEGGRRRGWGSLRVVARVGATEWRTSIFPGDSAPWLLPVKAEVRRAEGIGEDQEFILTVTV